MPGPQGPPGATGATGPQGPQGSSTVPNAQASMGNTSNQTSIAQWPIGESTVQFNPIATTPDVTFNSGTGIFTILVTGVYRFAVAITNSQRFPSKNVTLSVNVGVSPVLSFAMARSNRITSSISSSLSLTAGDQVTFVSHCPVEQFVPASSITSSVDPYSTVYRMSVTYFYRVI